MAKRRCRDQGHLRPSDGCSAGHHLVLLAHDDHGLMAAIEATAPDLDTDPTHSTPSHSWCAGISPRGGIVVSEQVPRVTDFLDGAF